MTGAPDITPPEVLTGTLERRVIGAGSKSEMAAVVLVSSDAEQPEVALRLRDAAALDAEPALLKFVGRRVQVTGRRRWATFVVEHIAPLDPPSG